MTLNVDVGYNYREANIIIDIVLLTVFYNVEFVIKVWL